MDLTTTPWLSGSSAWRHCNLGPEMLFAAKIAVVPRRVPPSVGDDRSGRGQVREAEPMVTALYLEPDIYDPNHVPAPRPERPASSSH